MADVALGALIEGATTLGLRSSAISRLDEQAVIGSVVHDSRRVESRSLFLCVPGDHYDGHAFADEAVAAGASALVVDHPLDLAVPQLEVDDVRLAMAPLAAAFHHRPSTELDLVGVTGTNGKTSITHLLASIAAAAGRKAEIIGTLSGAHTTPEAPELQLLIRTAVDQGVEVLALEVSSHALDQGRVDATSFAIGIFTNLSNDHLDFHGTMENYFEAKLQLFDGRCKQAVVNLDDAFGRRIAALVPGAIGYSLSDVTLLDENLRSTNFEWRGQRIELALAGRFNVSNAIGAAEAALAIGYEPADIAAGIAALPAIPGRMQLVATGADDEPVVLVDYSHTPDGIDKVLETVRALTPEGRLIVVFGAGGDRDREKRPLMGAAAARHADLCVVTSDNPRSEDPDEIIAEIVAGMAGQPSDARIVERDRRLAIERAIGHATSGDAVVIAGKGHETTQTIGTRVEEFSDVTVATQVLAAR